MRLVIFSVALGRGINDYAENSHNNTYHQIKLDLHVNGEV